MSQGVSLDVTRSQIKRWIIRWIELAPRDRLSAAFIKSAKPGKHCDGAGLWFHKALMAVLNGSSVLTDMASDVRWGLVASPV